MGSLSSSLMGANGPIQSQTQIEMVLVGHNILGGSGSAGSGVGYCRVV